jgi:lipopolysaccharide/colanic/teichoic acid biosynthesis glycosyltransferase
VGEETVVARATSYCLSFIWRTGCLLYRFSYIAIYLYAVLSMNVLSFVVGLGLVVISLPLQCFIGFCVLTGSGWPIIFRQRRVGKDGRIFVMYKFRSMVVGAEREQSTLRTRNESDGPTFKIRDDPRYTRIGKMLAHTGLDELPQLYNVLRGEMALFGPRPLPVLEAKKLKAWQKKRHMIKPGILSPAILTGMYHQDFDAWMKSDVTYAKEKSFLYDMQLLVRAGEFFLQLLWNEL